MQQLSVRAKVYTSRSGKVAIDCMANVDIGGIAYVNSYRIVVTDKSADKLVVLPPAYQNKFTKKWSPYVEFPNAQSNYLQRAIEEACISAYKTYESTGEYQQYGETFTVDLDNLIADESIGRYDSAEVVPTDVPDDFDLREALNRSNL